MIKYSHISKALVLSTALVGFSGCDSTSTDTDINATIQEIIEDYTNTEDNSSTTTDTGNGNGSTNGNKPEDAGTGNSSTNGDQNGTYITVDENGTTMIDGAGLIADINASELSATEITSILFIREEEKLARDVYYFLDDKWGADTQVFSNIVQAEQTHTDSVKALIDRYKDEYNLTDPMTEEEDMNLGVFQNEALQTHYDNLTSEGSESLIDALTVGATIEDLDIFDIENEITKVDNEDITAVYESLVSGSENHMKAFVRQLNNNDSNYTNQFISDERYLEILETLNDTGHDENTTTTTGHDDNGTMVDGATLIADIERSELSLDEIDSILFVREEEKLARDVYYYLDEMWGADTQVFANIVQAEVSHTDSVKALIDRYKDEYNLTDPMTEEEDMNLGVFQNEALQTHYDNLTSEGSESLISALTIGATIEDLDIFDIEAEVEKVDNEDITVIYENLISGSENHMRAFVRQLNSNDSNYTQQYITEERYLEILETINDCDENGTVTTDSTVETTSTEDANNSQMGINGNGDGTGNGNGNGNSNQTTAE
jgi:hypothetical protein